MKKKIKKRESPEDFFRDIPDGINKIIVYVNHDSGDGEILEVITEVSPKQISSYLFRTEEEFDVWKYKSVKILMVDENFTL